MLRPVEMSPSSTRCGPQVAYYVYDGLAWAKRRTKLFSATGKPMSKLLALRKACTTMAAKFPSLWLFESWIERICFLWSSTRVTNPWFSFFFSSSFIWGLIEQLAQGWNTWNRQFRQKNSLKQCWCWLTECLFLVHVVAHLPLAFLAGSEKCLIGILLPKEAYNAMHNESPWK